MRVRESRALKALLEKGGMGNPFWICGPCVIETRPLLGQIAEHLVNLSKKLNIPIVFKASFDKANRTSHQSFRGPGLEKGLQDLLWVKKEFGLPILTDIHEPSQAAAVAEVADILQIPAFLCRQSDLLQAAARTERLVNVKKGQFISPSNVAQICAKLTQFGAVDFWITERGTSFGYQRLVVDFAAFEEMKSVPLILDITHSVQLPGGQGESTGGLPNAIPYLARAGAAAGVRGFFAETHPEPSQALSDGPNAWPLEDLESLVVQVQKVAGAAHG